MTRPAIAPEMWLPLDQVSEETPDQATGHVNRGFWAGVRSRLFRHRPAMAGLAFIIFLITAAVLGPIASPNSYFEQNLELSNLPPTYRPYQVDDNTLVHVNTSNLSLYAVGENGGLVALIRRDGRDMINRQSTWEIEGRTVVLDYGQRPAVLLIDGVASQSGKLSLNIRNPFGTDQLGRMCSCDKCMGHVFH